MTPLDASRLLIASAASYFAKDSVLVLKRFKELRPISKRTRLTDTLENCLAKRIAELPMEVPPPEDVSPSPEWQQRFGARGSPKRPCSCLTPSRAARTRRMVFHHMQSFAGSIIGVTAKFWSLARQASASSEV
jgi:hypothetical protein